MIPFAAKVAFDKHRDLSIDFKAAGFAYAPDKAALDQLDGKTAERLLGLFALSKMNVALDKIDGRRGARRYGFNGAVVDD